MMQWILLTLLFIFNLLFMNMKHPLAMGLTLLIQTILITMMTGMINKTFWFSYILFLVFLGGMMVMFIYVTSLASNEMFSLSIKLLMFCTSFFLFSMFFMYFINKNMLMNYYNYETMLNNNMNNYLLENSLSIYKLYNYPNNLLTIMLMIYLLITLIIVIKITKIHKGPLRPLFN